MTPPLVRSKDPYPECGALARSGERKKKRLSGLFEPQKAHARLTPVASRSSFPAKMHRFFGRKKKPKKPTGPEVKIDDVTQKMESRGDEMDAKVAKMDRELAAIKKKLKKAKGSARRSLMNKARMIMKRKQMYMKSRERLYNQQFNLDQTKFAQESLQNTKQIVQAMKHAKQEMKVGLQETNIDEIEDLQDDMEELLEDNDEVQDILGRAYGVPEEMDDDELMAEFDALDDEVLDEEEEEENEETPAYLVSATSAARSGLEAKEGKHEVSEAVPTAGRRELA